MAKSKQKWYVVWNGTEPGIYLTWDECKARIHGVKGARYKSYHSPEEAQAAFEAGYQPKEKATAPAAEAPQKSIAHLRLLPEQLADFPEIDPRSIAVDAACSGNPGMMEYRCVYVFGDPSMPNIFHFGPIMGTNNIAEFLAIVHALALLKQKGDTKTVIYSDSRNAMLWVNKKKCKTTIPHSPKFAKAHEMIARAEKWLQENEVVNRVVKWETKRWGQIPADFGRK
ncbi:MAG: ribonuclease H family protein [Bacteroidales bacterium]|nr:ribonuclease H family protein [Bacteroidales bacterium]